MRTNCLALSSLAIFCCAVFSAIGAPIEPNTKERAKNGVAAHYLKAEEEKLEKIKQMLEEQLPKMSPKGKQIATKFVEILLNKKLTYEEFRKEILKLDNETDAKTNDEFEKSEFAKQMGLIEKDIPLRLPTPTQSPCQFGHARSRCVCQFRPSPHANLAMFSPVSFVPIPTQSHENLALFSPVSFVPTPAHPHANLALFSPVSFVPTPAQSPCQFGPVQSHPVYANSGPVPMPIWPCSVPFRLCQLRPSPHANLALFSPVSFVPTPAQSLCQFGPVQSRFVCANSGPVPMPIWPCSVPFRLCQLRPSPHANLALFSPILFMLTPAQSPCQFGPVQSRFSRFVCANSGPVPMPIWPCLVPFRLCQLRPSPHANLALFSPVSFVPTPAQSPCQFGPVQSHPVYANSSPVPMPIWPCSVPFRLCQLRPSPHANLALFSPVSFVPTPAQSPCQFGPVQSHPVYANSGPVPMPIWPCSVPFRLCQLRPSPHANLALFSPVSFVPTPAQSPCQFGHARSRCVCQFRPSPHANLAMFSPVSFVPIPTQSHENLALFSPVSPVSFVPTPAQSPCQFGPVQSRFVCANSGPVPMPIWPCSVPFRLCQLRPSPRANLAMPGPVAFANSGPVPMPIWPCSVPFRLCQFRPSPMRIWPCSVPFRLCQLRPSPHANLALFSPVSFVPTPAQSPCQFGPVQSRFVCANSGPVPMPIWPCLVPFRLCQLRPSPHANLALFSPVSFVPTPAQSPCQFGPVQSHPVYANSSPVPMPIWPCSVPFRLCQLRPSPHANLALFSPVSFVPTPAQSPCQFGPVQSHPVYANSGPVPMPIWPCSVPFRLCQLRPSPHANLALFSPVSFVPTPAQSPCQFGHARSRCVCQFRPSPHANLAMFSPVSFVPIPTQSHENLALFSPVSFSRFVCANSGPVPMPIWPCSVPFRLCQLRPSPHANLALFSPVSFVPTPAQSPCQFGHARSRCVCQFRPSPHANLAMFSPVSFVPIPTQSHENLALFIPFRLCQLRPSPHANLALFSPVSFVPTPAQSPCQFGPVQSHPVYANSGPVTMPIWPCSVPFRLCQLRPSPHANLALFSPVSFVPTPAQSPCQFGPVQSHPVYANSGPVPMPIWPCSVPSCLC
ncbi:hypothetical protein niasHT_034487 [Heterodera trifolii]|uniref:Uncharacterized protein n=1 Tax=Heterodera trifolii TaxID=157864 RepID=A0ABD2HUX1_9BILA